MSTNDLVEMSVSVVNAHLSMNRMSSRDVPTFIRQVHETLRSLRGGTAAIAGEAAAPTPVPSETPGTAPATEPPVEETAPPAAAPPEEAAAPALSNKIAPIRQEDISDPAFEGLNEWLAKRISPNTANKLDPSNPIHPSVFPEYLICLEDGAKIKLLRPYIKNRFDLSVAEYMDKWNLPDDYPTAPPAYIERKRAAAKESGLGVTTRAHREKKKPAASTRTTAARGTKGRTRAQAAATGKAEKASDAPKTTRGRGPGTRRKLSLFQEGERTQPTS